MSILSRIFASRRRKLLTIGILGAPNAGKTTLAVGVVSPVPHETRECAALEHCVVADHSGSLDMTIVDTPGIATSIDYREFQQHGLSRQDSITRAKEATRGVIKAIQSLDKMDAAIV
ncbi:MAG: GTPase [Candidatus Hodarchaeales archaeon]|jgi:GTPase Era involved in 16S rRNA processing